ncbi:gas vesicle protein GvpN [Virgibacillus dakarensis]|uniref:ATPase n=1 Tax=Lentibacillus populi TaxID=1827502 RepID=A0A9W5TVK7_9BACI|nr:gas vesicle protein GvpN [Lentibacillus populi]MBT2218413.1 gas vesicle protein GvpN [Virgibacillus dakarensis]MTW87494.1 gas vesicle protein GvpN [Virgibacillus dakarensis]GGB35681.1 ATPase [Lentibacillus populi]
MTFLKENIIRETTAFFQDDGLENLMSRSLDYLVAGYPVHFTGPSGAGKTSLALAVAKKRKRPVMLMHGNHVLSNEDLIGAFTGYSSKKVVDNYIHSVYKKEENVKELWRNGRLLEAVKKGYTLIYDEFTRSRPSTNNLFLSILEEGVLPLYGTKYTEPFVRVHPEFNVIFTSNPAEYAGVYPTQDALLDRLITIPLGYKDNETEAAIVQRKTGVSENEAKAITAFVSQLRKICSGDDSTGPSLRASMMIARLVEEADISVDGSDKEFQQLCRDILWYPVSRCLAQKGFDEKADDLIIKECRKVSVKEE